ncbi:MAG: excinuclease ABC subunit UvrB [Chloroflexi bacterium]|nr:excinuclease ABC subunit UvrB [Chloroflexota bacterium]
MVAIGELIDAFIKQAHTDTQPEGDTVILDAQAGSVQYYAQSFDPETCRVDLRPIRSFIRHTAPTEMYRLRTACGRSATLTGDHNLWVLREGHLQLVKTSEARPTDYVPVPETLLAYGQRRTLDTLALLSDTRLFVEAPEAVLTYTDTHGAGLVVRAFAESALGNPHGRLSAIRHHSHGRGIQVKTFLHLLDRTEKLGGKWDPDKASVGGKSRRDRLPAQLQITPELLGLLGYYIAEGNHQHGYVIIANRDETVRQHVESALAQLGIPFSTRPSSDYQISSTALAELLKRLCGTIARDKHLPDFWLELSAASLGQLLRAYFDGDGAVGRASDISATTASPRLASDLTYALLRLGMWARVKRRWKRATNSQHSGDWYYSITVSGQANLRRFQQAIGFSIPRKQQALVDQLKHTEHSNVDIVPLRGSELRWLRNRLGLTAETLGEWAGISRGAIQLFETQKRAPRRVTMLKILEVLRRVAARVEGISSAWWQVWQSLRNLCQVHWTSIAAVEKIQYPYPFVYDLCVPGTETFLAGTGGFFVHNTFVMAAIIEKVQKPTLVIAHNKTLAAQLYSEFREFFPHNAVEYFVSYYDYYQPEAYVPQHDLYIEKDSSINEEIDRLRLAATSALLSRRDVVIVASVSCIYGLGSPEEYGKVALKIQRGEMRNRDRVIRHLVEIHYERNDYDLGRGKFRVRGDTLEVAPAYGEFAYRIEFFGDEVERIAEVDTTTGEVLSEQPEIEIFPAKHFITPQDKLAAALGDIERELETQIKTFNAQGKLIEAQRIEQRTKYDLEMMREVGYCSGIENYSRPLAQREPGSPPWTLLDYFPDDFLMFIDESHMTVPQIHGMFNGDRARKTTLVDFGFRLPSALDNRPLRFEEFEKKIYQTIFVSATPADYELKVSEQVVEQIIRPTGLIDPEVSVRPIKGQIDDLIAEIKTRVTRGERVLVTTLTKRMAEDLSEYLHDIGIKVHYLHSEIQTLERIEILRDLRLGVYDVIVGINLLREGLDLPEVSLVAILDADKEGFLRSGTALIQTIGRAARHVNGQVIMYADKITDSMRRALDETTRRRQVQTAHNTEHHIEPQGIVKEIRDLTQRVHVAAESRADYKVGAHAAALPKDEATRLIAEFEKQMKEAAKNWEFEKAALLRDQILELRATLDAQDARPEWQKVMQDRDHHELEEWRAEKVERMETSQRMETNKRMKGK